MPVVETAYWEVRVDNYVGIPWVSIGVATKEHSVDHKVCDTPYLFPFWMITCQIQLGNLFGF